MATNNILPFCPTDTGTNLLTQIEYAGATGRDEGNQPGIASSKLVNKAIRQATFIAAQFAQYLCFKTGNDVLDDDNDATLLATIKSAFFYAKIQTLAAVGNVNAETDICELGGGSYTATLPAVATVTGRKFCLKYPVGATGTKTISPAIDGATLTMDTEGQFINVYSNGVTYGTC